MFFVVGLLSLFFAGMSSLATRSGVAQARIIRVVNTNATPGSAVNVSVELVAQGNEAAMGFSLTFNPAILSSPQTTLGSGAAGAALNPNINQVAQGRLGIVLALPAGQAFPAGTRQLVSINFAVAGNAPAGATPIGFGNQPVGQEVSDVSANELVTTFTGGTVTVQSACSTINITPANLPAGTAGVAYTQTLTANGGTSPYTFSLSAGSAPAGLNLSAAGALTGTPSSAGNSTFTVKATDANGCAGTQSYTVTINPPALPPSIIRVVSTTATAGGNASVPIELVAQGNEAAMGFSITFNTGILSNPQTTLGSGAAGATLNANLNQVAQGRLGIVVALPSGQSFPAGTRQLVVVNFAVAGNAPAGATPIGFGNQPVGQEVSDVNANVLTTTFTGGTVTVQVPCPTITISPATLASGQLGQPYSQQLTQTGGAGTIAWTISAGALPNGVTLGASTGLLSGTPVASGNFAFTVKATDANGCLGTQAYTLAIGCPVITISPTTLPAAVRGQAYSQTLTATGGTPNYTFSFNGTPPSGLNLSSTGALTGSGTYPAGSTSLSFAVKVTDAGGCTGTQSYTVSITAGTYTVSGRVVDQAGNGIVDVSMTYRNSAGVLGGPRTDANGNWTDSNISSIPHSCAEPFSVTPSKSGFTFTPLSRTFCAASSSLDFTGIPTVTTVSAASFRGAELAQESIVAAFGVNLATKVEVASATPLPTTLAGTTVKVKDSAGTERLSPLFFVAPTQINYQIPPGTAVGVASVTVTNGDNQISLGTINVAKVAPGLFTANSSGQGVPAAVVLRIRNGVQTFEPVSRFDATQGIFVPVPIDQGPDGDVVYLLFYGVGIRNRTQPSAITTNIGALARPLDPSRFEDGFAAAGFVGLDQVNVLLPARQFLGETIDVVLTVDGKPSNPVRIAIKAMSN
jgi:uncharacterized protein (TIGR03437 family)